MKQRLSQATAMALTAGLIGCGDKGDGTATDTMSSADDITYYEHVVPVLAENCTRCHYDGGLGPADFTDADTVMDWSTSMHSAIESGRMAPSAADPTCQDYVGSELLTVSDDEKATFEAWIDGGMPLGDPSDTPEIPVVSGELSNPDIEVLLPEAYTPIYIDEENPDNEYRCFVIDPELDDDVYITAMAPIVDQDTIIHHAVLFTVPEDAVSEAWRDPSGVDCIDGGGGNNADAMIAGWAPGMLPIEFPENTGMKLGADSVLVLQMHYFTSGSATEGISDRSGYAFRVQDTVETEVIMAPLGSTNFRIPADEPAHTHEDSFTNTYLDIDIHGVFPHMHRLGTEYAMSIEEEDGTETCVVRGDYDFDNQMTYQFPEPLLLPMGAKLTWSCTWNNSSSNPALEGAEPETVRYGERTDEEMCFFFSLISY